MNVHEYQAKELLEAAGATIPKHIVASSPEEALKATDEMGLPIVLKAQIHAGGRGKGQFLQDGGQPVLLGSDPVGGVKFCTSKAKVEELVPIYFNHRLRTIQTLPEGQPVSKVLVQQAVDIKKRDENHDEEFYLGMVLDRAIGKPVMMASREGGVEIEEVAKTNPDAILKAVVDPALGLQGYQARNLAFGLGFEGDQVKQAVAIMLALAKVFLEKDLSMAEINPLVLTEQGDVVVLDAKFNFDDNALFRHPDIQALRDEAEEDPAEMRAGAAGLSYINLTGNIACLVNGAGLAMSTMDIIKYHGGEPANSLDVGGGAQKEAVTEAFRIILSDDRVKAVLVNIFGGIMQCDTIAEAVLAAFDEVGFHVPLVVRLEGTNVEQGRKLLEESGKKITTASDLTDAAQKVVAAAKGA
ncbi:MAG: ADP-forming succinate--CoA ligase subunit beta [Gemmataceae bacterium]